MIKQSEGMSIFEFAVAMTQVEHNKKNPDHKCECKSIGEMIGRHFQIHKEKSK